VSRLIKKKDKTASSSHRLLPSEKRPLFRSLFLLGRQSLIIDHGSRGVIIYEIGGRSELPQSPLTVLVDC
jgi:hypothetical protein